MLSLYSTVSGKRSALPGGGKGRGRLRVGGVGAGSCSAKTEEGNDECGYGKDAFHGQTPIRSVGLLLTHSVADVADCHNTGDTRSALAKVPMDGLADSLWFGR
jgi:hypothetical protein